MFHLIFTVCLAASATDCGQILLPRGDAATQQACQEAADRIAGRWLAERPYLTASAPECRANADLPAADLQPVAAGVHVHLGQSRQMEETADGRIANLGVVIGEDAVAVIDAGVSRAEGQALYVAIRRLTEKPIRYLVLTHMHPDHVLGAGVMAEAGAEVLGHHALPQGLQARADTYLGIVERLYPPVEWVGTQVVMPDRTVADRLEIDLGDRVLELTAWPPAHSDNDLTVLDRETGTLFTGDLVFRQLTPVVEGSLAGWSEWLDSRPAADARLIVPGHGPVAESWATASDPQRVLLKSLADETRKAIAAGYAMSEAVPMIVSALQPLARSWNSFEATVARDATVAYKELEWE